MGLGPWGSWGLYDGIIIKYIYVYIFFGMADFGARGALEIHSSYVSRSKGFISYWENGELVVLFK
jgi:hypothetical protein